MKFLKRIIAFASAAALSMTVLSSCNNKALVTPSKKELTEMINLWLILLRTI